MAFVYLCRRLNRSNYANDVTVRGRRVGEDTNSAFQEGDGRIFANGVNGRHVRANLHLSNVLRANVRAGRVNATPFRVFPSLNYRAIFSNLSRHFNRPQVKLQYCLIMQVRERRIKNIPIIKVNFLVIFVPFTRAAMAIRARQQRFNRDRAREVHGAFIRSRGREDLRADQRCLMYRRTITNERRKDARFPSLVAR